MEILKYLAEARWESPTHFDEGIEQFVLADTLDEVGKRGIRTRIVRFAPGAYTRVPFVHDYHEEVYVCDGEQILLDDKAALPVASYPSGTYFQRPAGIAHGPFTSREGCLLLEIHYY